MKTEKRQSEIRIPVTAGSIRNGYVSVRDHLWFFPKSSIRGERAGQGDVCQCLLELPELGVVETDIDADKGMFRWRGWKRFYRQHGAAEGDELVIRRVAPDRFTVTVARRLLDGFAEQIGESDSQRAPDRKRRSASQRCNDLSGEEWLRFSISVWSDIKKTAEETALSHPAMFPTSLCERLMLMFLRRKGKHRILDPFVGSGSTIVAARGLGKVGIGFDISKGYLRLAKRRLDTPGLFADSAVEYEFIHDDARNLLDHVRPDSIDLCITSPPYWDILNQRRTADYKEIRHYGNRETDLGIITDYKEFLAQLADIFQKVLQVLRPGAYCVVVVMDLRKKNRFFPLHSDLAARLIDAGFLYDDLIIWDRGQEYNNLRPLGYPSVFRINKIHEFILIFQKPSVTK